MPTDTIDRDQLIAMAADELLIVGAGQSLENEDKEKIDGRVDGLLGELSARHVANVPDDQEIPIELGNGLAQLLADACAGIFGRAKMPDETRIMIEARLRTINASNPTLEPLVVEYF